MRLIPFLVLSLSFVFAVKSAQAGEVTLLLPHQHGIAEGDLLQIAPTSDFVSMTWVRKVKNARPVADLPFDKVYHWRLLAQKSGKLKMAGSFFLMGPGGGGNDGFQLTWQSSKPDTLTWIRIIKDGQRQQTLLTRSQRIFLGRFKHPVILSINHASTSNDLMMPSLQVRPVNLGEEGIQADLLITDQKPVVSTAPPVVVPVAPPPVAPPPPKAQPEVPPEPKPQPAPPKVEKDTLTPVDETDGDYDSDEREFPWEQPDLLAHDRAQNRFGISRGQDRAKEEPELPRKSYIGITGLMAQEASEVKRQDQYEVKGAIVVGPGVEMMFFPNDVVSLHLWGDSHGTNNDYGDGGIDRPSSQQKRLQGYGSVGLDLMNLISKSLRHSITIEYVAGSTMIPIATDDQRMPLRGVGLSWMQFTPEGTPISRVETATFQEAGHLVKYSHFFPQMFGLKFINGMAFVLARQTNGDKPDATSQFTELGLGGGLFVAF